jgi:hypothetical protein
VASAVVSSRITTKDWDRDCLDICVYLAQSAFFCVPFPLLAELLPINIFSPIFSIPAASNPVHWQIGRFVERVSVASSFLEGPETLSRQTAGALLMGSSCGPEICEAGMVRVFEESFGG